MRRSDDDENGQLSKIRSSSSESRDPRLKASTFGDYTVEQRQQEARRITEAGGEHKILSIQGIYALSISVAPQPALHLEMSSSNPWSYQSNACICDRKQEQESSVLEA